MSQLDEIKAYDQRQMNLMLQSLNDYKSEKISLIGLGETLQNLASCLQKIDLSWKKQFFNLCGGLVIISDLMEYDKRIDKFINDKEKAYVKERVDTLIKLLKEQII